MTDKLSSGGDIIRQIIPVEKRLTPLARTARHPIATPPPAPIVDLDTAEEVLNDDLVIASIAPPIPPVQPDCIDSGELSRKQAIQSAILEGVSKAKPFEDGKGPEATDTNFSKCINQHTDSINTICTFLHLPNNLFSAERLTVIATTIAQSANTATSAKIADKIYQLLEPNLPTTTDKSVLDAITTLAFHLANTLTESIILLIRYRKNFIRDVAIQAKNIQQQNNKNGVFVQNDYKNYQEAQKFLENNFKKKIPGFKKSDLHDWFTSTIRRINARSEQDIGKSYAEIFFETVSHSTKYIEWTSEIAAWEHKTNSIELSPETAAALKTIMIWHLLILWDRFKKENQLDKQQAVDAGARRHSNNSTFLNDITPQNTDGSKQTPISVSPPPAVNDIPQPVNQKLDIAPVPEADIASLKTGEQLARQEARTQTRRIIPNWMKSAATALLFTGIGAIATRAASSSHTTTPTTISTPVTLRNVENPINTTLANTASNNTVTLNTTPTVNTESPAVNNPNPTIEFNTDAIIGINGLQSSFTLALTQKASIINSLLALDPRTRNAAPVLISRLASLLTKGSLPATIDSLVITSSNGTIPRTWDRSAGYQYQVNVDLQITKSLEGQDIITLRTHLQRRRNSSNTWETPPTPSNYEVVLKGSLIEFTARYQAAHRPTIHRGAGFVANPPY